MTTITTIVTHSGTLGILACLLAVDVIEIFGKQITKICERQIEEAGQ